MEFKYDTPNQEANAADLAQAKNAVFEARSVQELIFNWVSDEYRSITICPGLPMPEDAGDVMLFLLQVNGREVGQAVVLESEIMEAFPGIGPISDCLVPEARADNIEGERQNDLIEDGYCDEAWLDELEQQNGGVWNDDLYASIFGKEGAVRVALSYALARNGKASISMVSESDKSDVYQDADFSQFPEKVYSLSTMFNHEKNGLGFGGNYFIF